jgi:hypothetical protein
VKYINGKRTHKSRVCEFTTHKLKLLVLTCNVVFDDVLLREDNFGFRRGKLTRDAIWMLRIISEGTLDIEEEMCRCFIDWQREFGRVKWTKLLHILKVTGVDWHGRKLITKLYMDQNMKLNWTKGRHEM